MRRFIILTCSLNIFFLIGCKTNNTENSDSVKTDSMPIIEIKEVVNLPEITIIGEHHINDSAITNHPTAKPNHKVHEMSKEEIAIKYNTMKAKDIHDLLMKSCTMVNKEKFATKPDGKIISKYLLDETQTYIAFDKGNWIGSIAVVSDAKSGDVDQIIFTDSTHQDVYNVKLGMTAKQINELRKEMKFIQHEGSNYMYSEDSNIMYLMDVKDENGKEHDELRQERATVTAIVWKDKNHLEHPSKLKVPLKKG